MEEGGGKAGGEGVGSPADATVFMLSNLAPGPPIVASCPAAGTVLPSGKRLLRAELQLAGRAARPEGEGTIGKG